MKTNIFGVCYSRKGRIRVKEKKNSKECMIKRQRYRQTDRDQLGDTVM